MIRRRTAICAAILGLILFVLPVPLRAQPPDSAGDPFLRSVKFSYSAAALYQFSSDLDRDGDFSVARFFLNFNAVSPVTPALRLGFGIGYQFADYDFSGYSLSSADSPWDQIHSLGFSLPIVYAPGKDWTIFVGPSFRFDAESDADWTDAFTYGGILSASYRFSPTLTIGPGVGLFDRFGEFKAFPFIAVFWEINDQFRVSNPFQAGPVGPAGLELVYTPDEKWEFAFGGAYRSFRFRLDDTGVAPKGSGEDRFFPLFARMGRKLEPNIGIELLGGVMLGGELTLNNADDNELVSEDYDPAPFLSLLLSGRF
jgi:hypothetical protein